MKTDAGVNVTGEDGNITFIPYSNMTEDEILVQFMGPKQVRIHFEKFLKYVE